MRRRRAERRDCVEGKERRRRPLLALWVPPLVLHGLVYLHSSTSIEDEGLTWCELRAGRGLSDWVGAPQERRAPE